MATQRIKLNKPIDGHKLGDTINATAAELKERDLKPGVDYLPLGTHPNPVKSDLAPESKPDKDEADPKTTPGSQPDTPPKK